MSELKYFNGIADEAMAGAMFRKLSKELHPDRGGNPKKFSEMKEEYEAWKVLKKYGKLGEKPPQQRKQPKPTKQPKPPKAEKPPEIAIQEPQTDIVDDLHKVVDGLAGIMNLFSKI